MWRMLLSTPSSNIISTTWHCSVCPALCHTSLPCVCPRTRRRITIHSLAWGQIIFITRNIFISPLLDLRCVATGWGQTTKDGGLEDRLHQAVLRVQNNTDCGQVTSEWGHYGGHWSVFRCTVWGTGWTSPPSISAPAPTPGPWLGPAWWVFREYSESELRTIVVITGRQRRTTAVQPQGEMSLVCWASYHLIWHWEQRLHYTSSRDNQQLIMVINIFRMADGISWGWHHSGQGALSPAFRTSLWGFPATPPGSGRSSTTTTPSRDRRSSTRH